MSKRLAPSNRLWGMHRATWLEREESFAFRIQHRR